MLWPSEKTWTLTPMLWRNYQSNLCRKLLYCLLNAAAIITIDKSLKQAYWHYGLVYSESTKMASVFFNSLKVECELQIFKTENIYQVDKVSAKEVSLENILWQSNMEVVLVPKNVSEFNYNNLAELKNPNPHVQTIEKRIFHFQSFSPLV